MRKYPLFHDVFETVKKQSRSKGVEWFEEIREMAKGIAEVRSSSIKVYSLELHIKGLICAMLTSQTVFDLNLGPRIADGTIDRIFTNPANHSCPWNRKHNTQ